MRLETLLMGINSDDNSPVDELMSEVDEHVIWVTIVNELPELCIGEVLVDVALNHHFNLQIVFVSSFRLEKLHVIDDFQTDERFETLLEGEKCGSLP